MSGAGAPRLVTAASTVGRSEARRVEGGKRGAKERWAADGSSSPELDPSEKRKTNPTAAAVSAALGMSCCDFSR